MSYDDEDFEQEDRFSFSYNLGDDDDDTDSYIEIAFEPISNIDDYDDKNGGEEDEDVAEFEFRISFSTLPSFPPLCSPHMDNLISYKEPEIGRSPSMSLSSVSDFSSASSLISSSSTTASRHSESWSRASLKPPLSAPLASGVGDSKGQFYESLKSDIPSSKADWGQLHGRKPSKPVTAMNGNIMKFFFKFRALNFQSVLSFVKKSQKTVQQGNNSYINNRTKTGQRDKKQNHNNNKKLIKKYSSRMGDKPGLSSINLNTIKGIVEEVMGVSFGRRKQMTTSNLNKECKMMCTRDSSVQSAISHCKMSFGQY